VPQKSVHTVARKVFVGALLLLAIFAVYGQVVHHDFIQLDDNAYLLDNSHVRSGITPENITWAFTTFHASNWHPLTWLSHMADVQFFGMNPGRHHLINVALHMVNTLLLFQLLCRITGAFWRSAAVAALFAVHPLHVESVAWVAERKDVLSALFFMLTLNFYAGYAEQRKRTYYVLALFAFAMGLMAKPMLVTVPFVLLLLDYWPLLRIHDGDYSKNSTAPWRPLTTLLLEKIPFLIFAAATCAVTIAAQQNAMASLESRLLSDRLANAVVAYLSYLGKLLWPLNLAVFYPFPKFYPLWHPLMAGALLVAISLFVIRVRQRRPYLFVGWFWYLGTLVPVIGILMVGLQAMADRYTYLPMIGIYILAVWGAHDMFAKVSYRRSVLIFLAVVLFPLLSVVSWRQVGFWRNTTTLFSHAIDVTSGNYLAHYILGRELVKAGQYNQARRHFDEAEKIAPWYEEQKMRKDLAGQK
jgi:tetratricopeptide (TPR) repeat protein